MRKANLKVLGIEVPLKLRDVYHDDGFVSSVRDHRVELAEKYGQSSIVDRYGAITAPQAIGEAFGGYVGFSGVFRTHHHIFYKDVGFVENLISRGHEEAEFLEEIDRLDLLTVRLIPYTNRPLYFNHIRDEEVRNHFGAVYALIRFDVPVEKIFEVCKPHPQFDALKFLLKHYEII
jgi:hypothetical protein